MCYLILFVPKLLSNFSYFCADSFAHNCLQCTWENWALTCLVCTDYGTLFPSLRYIHFDTWAAVLSSWIPRWRMHLGSYQLASGETAAVVFAQYNFWHSGAAGPRTLGCWVIGRQICTMRNARPPYPWLLMWETWNMSTAAPHSWVQFTSALFWDQILLRRIRFSSWPQVAHHVAEGMGNWNAGWQVLPLVSRSRQWEVDGERTKFNGNMHISSDFEEWPRLPRKGVNEGRRVGPLNCLSNLAFLNSPDMIIIFVLLGRNRNF